MDTQTSPKLPALREGPSSLVCQEKLPSPPTPREQASEWAKEARNRINHYVEHEAEVPEADVGSLKQELIPVFITCLQQDTRHGWMYLTEVMDILEPYSSYLDMYDIKDELYHYLERLIYHAQLHREKLFDLHIVDALQKVFPHEVSQIRSTNQRKVRNYCVTIPSVRMSAETPGQKRSLVPSPPSLLNLPDGSNPYSMYINTEEQLKMIKPLTFGDLRKSLAAVAVDMATRESIWSHTLGPVAQALQTDIPEPQGSPEKSPEKEVGGYKLTPRTGIANYTAAERKFKKTPRIEDDEVPKMSGRDAVAYFVKAHHLGNIRSLFFNYAPSRHFAPYDLVCVHKNQVEPEHYVFSTFGVLHVLPDAPAESMGLSDWQREAVLWKAISHIPFFKNYLTRKMFDRWRSNKLRLDFLRRQDAISGSLLQNVPVFGAALIQILRLLKELITVTFLPFDIDKMYQLSDFENNVNYKNIQAEKILEKFFSYCKMVVDRTAEESFNKLRYCEEQVKKKTYLSKDSLHMQKFKREQREENLRLARSETGRLGNFVKLVDQMIVEHMFHLTKTQVTLFVRDVLDVGQTTLRDGFFKANLVFTRHDVLGISPTRETFTRVLIHTLKGIPGVLCAQAVPMDGAVTEPGTEPQGEEEEGESPHLKSENAKSSSEYSHNVGSRPALSERRKSTAATSSVKLGGSHTGLSTARSRGGGTTTSVAPTERTIPMSKTKSCMGDEDLKIPELPTEETHTKDEDEIGIATPDLVIPYKQQDLVVEGEGFMGQYQPLTRASLEEKLEKDEHFQGMLKVTSGLLKESLEEIEAYCEFNKWLNEIHQFSKRWTEKSVREYKGEAAFTIEQKLTELRQWSEKVRNFDHSFHTSNGLFFVDCGHIHDILLPRLNEIYSELVTFVAEEAKCLANNFCADMKTVIENMKNKQPSVDLFATYAKNYNQYKKNTTSYQQKVEYIKSLYEVIRMSYRQLTTDEEKYEENVWASWEAFLLQMQDASEFVNTQTPLMTQLLEDTYQKLEAEAYELEEQATNGKFLDPDQNPTAILMEMKHIRDKFYEIQTQLHKASKWREAICGEPYDLTFLNDMMTKLDVRQELWKYVEVSTHAIKDWRSMLFKKMNIKKALEKIIEWQSAVSQLKPYLPSQDRVLTSWFQALQDFKKDLPVLHKLANDALKERHWKAIFVGMNESYDPKKQFTVADLLTYDLKEHDQLVNQIYLGAVAEYDLELKIGHMKKFWLEREFKLAKHIPDSLLASKEAEQKEIEERMLKAARIKRGSIIANEKKLMKLKALVRLAKLKRAEPAKKPSSPRRRTKLEKYRQERAAQLKDGTQQGLNVADDDYYILIELEELKYQLEDSQISIAGMMQSPYLGDMTAEVESWASALQQVEEIADLWYTCQKKWLYLLKVFEWPQLYKRFKTHAPKFEEVHAKMKDWMRVVSNDSKVLTVINRRRGEKGYRLLQGDNLRSLFLTLIQMEEEILKHLSSLMENCRQEFSRLYFLSDEELVEMLGVSRNPQALTPFAKKCFPGIQSLAFALPPGTSSLNTHLDFALHADKLQVIALRGVMGEELPFFAHLEAQRKSTRWLKLLEGIMKNTMATVLQACVQTRIEDGGKVQPVHVIEEITNVHRAKTEQTVEDITADIKHAYGHWLLRFPAQCVHVTEGILWARGVQRALEKPEPEPDDLRFLKMNLGSKLDQYVDILRDIHKTGATEEVRSRLQTLVTILVTQNIEQRDYLDAMLLEPEVSENSFTWLRLLHYHMEVRNVLRAKQEPVEPLPPSTQPDPGAVRRANKNVRRKSRKESVDSSPIQSMSRTKTSVSTDFQFSRCTLQQLGNVFPYDYEYLGPYGRLVMTPLTERAFLSLTQALKNFHCGTLIGPPGTGKSETVKDLGKLFGCCLFTVSCNSEVTLTMMTQYMMGMVQSGCWALFDDTDRLTKGLMSVTAQHLDHLRTALRTLDASSENQYKIRGQPRSDKKTGVGDAVIRRNSLTTLHPLPNSTAAPQLERQKTVPHGFNEKGLVTYFEETWIAEKEQRRHSIEREIEIQESDLYNKNKPPPLFYEHARFKGKKAFPDYSKLLKEALYRNEVLGNVMFQGKLVQASANFACFMTLNITNPAAAVIPETFRVLLRPCAMIQPDLQPYIEATLLCHGYAHYSMWAQKLLLFAKLLKMQLPRKEQYSVGFRDLKMVLKVSVPTRRELQEEQNNEKQTMEDDQKQTQTKMDTPPLVDMDARALEEQSIILGLVEVFRPRLESEDDRGTLGNILRDVFPLSSKPQSHAEPMQDIKLINAVRDQLNEDNLKETPEIMNKIMQLYNTIQQSESVIITGASGSGKSTCVGVLARALNRLNYLLFAPDHSKDELSTDRGVLNQVQHKLKELGMEQFIAAEEEFLSRLGAPKVEQSKGTQKLKHSTSVLTKVNEAIHEMEVKKSPEYAMFPKIDLVRLNPTALSSQELLGQFEDGLWQGGLIQKILREAGFMSDAVKTYLQNYKKQEQTKQKQKTDLPSVLLKWIVLDGVLHPNWTEGLNTVLDSERKLSMANGGHVALNVESTKLLFEATDLTHISPSTVAHCSIIHSGEETVNWTSLFECWAKTAKSKWIFTSDCMKVIIDIAHDVFGPTIKFLNSECTTALLTDVGYSVAMANRVLPGIHAVTSFIMMYSALLDRGFSRDEFEKKITNREPDDLQAEDIKYYVLYPFPLRRKVKKAMCKQHKTRTAYRQKYEPKPKADKDPVKTQTPTGTNSRMTSSSQIENNIPNYIEQMKGMFALAYIWAFGGNLHDRHRDKFSKFAHDILYGARHGIRLPLSGTVFDYCIDPGTGNFIKWSQRTQEKVKNIAQGYVVTPEVEKYTYLLDLLVTSHQPVLLVGQPGVGKTSLIHNMVLPKQTSTKITMSPGMTSAIFQEALMAHILELKSKALNVITSGPAATNAAPQKHLFFIDDLNTASKTEGYQPPLELLTQMLSQGGVYDRHRQQFQAMTEAIILAACTVPTCPGVGMGESCHVMSSRLTRLFMNITLYFPNTDGILSTFGRNIQHWLEEFPTYSVEHHFEYARALTLGLVELYQKVKEKFRPTPSHAHYVFSLHDISRVVQGIMLMSPRSRTHKMMKIKKDKKGSRTTSRATSLDSKGRQSLGSLSNSLSNPADLREVGGASPPMMKVIAQLWCHECTRTFADRLVTDDDCQWFSRTLEEIVVKQFCSPREDPKVEMAAITEETFSQSQSIPASPRAPGTPTPVRPPSPSDSEEEGAEGEKGREQPGETTHRTSSESEKSIDSKSTSSKRSLRGSIASQVSSKKESSSDSSADNQSVTLGESDNGNEALRNSGQTPAKADMGGAGFVSETEYETEDTGSDDSYTETETETDSGTPRGMTGTMATTIDDSSRGTSRTSATTTTLQTPSTLYKYSSTSTDNSDQTPPVDRRHSKLADDDFAKGTPRFKKQFSHRGSMGSSRHVHFKPGLMTDKEHIAFFGPLMKLDEIKGGQDTLTDFIFSKYFMTSHTEAMGLSIEKGYTDTTEETLGEALHTCLNIYNIGTSQRLELVFFKQAIHHAARLSRVLALQGGHGLLLGTSYSTGRATLVRLASYIAHCKMGRTRKQRRMLYEPKPQTDPAKNLRIVREHIKRACYHTGILAKPSVLLVHEDLGIDCLADVAAVMAEGTSPGLYTEDEMQAIVSQMMPGGVQTKRVDKIEQAFERFIKRIKQHLHVIVCLSYRGNSFSSNFKSLHTVMSRYPNLIKYSSCVDHYQPWPYDAYVKIARVWLQDERSRVHVAWHPTKREDQMEMTACAMAYVHLSAKVALERQYCHQRDPLRFFSPLTYMEFVHIFRIVCAYIVKKETGNIHKHERALAKVNEAFGSIDDFRREVSNLSPQHKAATEEIKGLVQEVEAQKQEYIAALDKCKEQEVLIEELQGPLERLRKDAQSEFDKFKKFKEDHGFADYYTPTQYRLNPNYKAAISALSALNRQDLDEVKSFRAPPELVKYVVYALCLLFDKPQDWENGKLLLTRENFIQDLIFYDKDNIPEQIFFELTQLVKEPMFQPERIEPISKAATGICVWVHSVQKYSEIHRNMQPRLKNLLEHEEKFTRAQAKLGQLRVDANRLKSGLERKIQIHKAAVKRAKTIFRQMQSIERKISRAVNLMENMSMQNFMWKSELRKAKHQIFTAPGDALITAACVCYQGPLSDKLRGELLQDWLERCKQGTFTLPKSTGLEVHSLGAGVDSLFAFDRQRDRDSQSDNSSTIDTQSESGIPSLPEVRTYKYQPVVFDTSKYYKSELKRQGSVEYEPAGNTELEDSDDEDEQSLLMTRAAYTVQDILSDFDELSTWRLKDLKTDLHSIQNALFMRVSSHNRKYCWPLLIDPDNQAETWVKAIQTSKNIFSEKDVTDGDDSEITDLPPVPSSDEKGEGPTPHPPSRGTAITFSDYNVEYPPDDTDTSRTQTTTNSYTNTDYTKRGSRESSWESEQLRPVTSVTASWEMYSLHPDQAIDHPEHNLWIIEADNPKLDSKLINAVVHGVTVLITHLERKPLDPLFRGLLLKHFYVDKEGNKVVRVGSDEFKYHPNFCLYLSTSVPLFLKGDGLHTIPIHRMCVINMALSDEAIINYLLSETMRVERKEFEGQKRSNENDIIMHRQKLAQQHEMIREKTLNLFGPILEDQTMLDSLINCQKEVERNKMILEETRYMGDHLEEKFSHYVPMIMQSAMLYSLIQRMAVLHSYYYMPFYKFVEMFTGVIKSRDRGKGTQGAPASRAKELCDAVFSSIFKYVSMMMFERHFLLLQLLVALERLHLQNKASSRELGIFLNGFDKQGIEEAALLEHKPDWMEPQAWVDCLVLEQVHHAFHGLRRSLIANQEQWREYFQHPVSLMNPVPGTTMQDIRIFQRCMLWRFACPRRLAEVSQALILYELGSIRMIPDHYNIREVYSYTTSCNPVVFVLPNHKQDMEASEATKGLPYVSPSHEVKRLAKEVGMEGKVKVMNFGVKGQVCEVKQAVEDCIQTGYWLLIQNYHLAEEPEQDFFQLLKDIVYTKWLQPQESDGSTVQEDPGPLVAYSRQDNQGSEFKVADTFRLWITTQSDIGRLIPGVLVQHGIKVTAESTGNFKSTLQKSYRSVAFLLNNFQLSPDESPNEKMGRIMPLALLHSLLLQQCYYGNSVFHTHHYWSLTDLAMAVDIFKKVMLKCPSRGNMPGLVAQVYTDHCVDNTDKVAVQALVETLAKYATLPIDQLPDKTDERLVVLLKRLLHMDEGTFNLKRAVDSLDELAARTFGLPDEADLEVTAEVSSILSRDMVQVIGAPELFSRVTANYGSMMIAREALIPQYIALVQALPMLPETDRNQYMPLDVFLHYEAEGYRRLIDTIMLDLNLLLHKARGEILPSPELNQVIYAINRNTVPASWSSEGFQTGMGLNGWFRELAVRLRYLRSYLLEERPATYCLSVFLRPDRFLEAVKQTYARKQFKDIDCIEFKVEVMPAGLKPSQPPPEGVFLSGLHLHNALWDLTRAVMMLPTPDSPSTQEMPLFWLKPLETSAAGAAQTPRRLYQLYKCPVFCARDRRHQGDRNIVVHFSLPTLCDPAVWQYQRVFLTTSLMQAAN